MAKCNSILYLRDDRGDNEVPIVCQLPLGHEGLHQEKYNTDKKSSNWVTITWEKSNRSV